MNTAVNPYISEYSELATALPGQALPWLQQLRRAALDKFSAEGFPSSREEEWRYTSVSALEKKRFVPAAAPVHSADMDLRAWQLQDAWTIVLLDGHFSAELSTLDNLPATVVVMSLAEALAKHPEKLQRYLGQAVSHTEHGFVAFNAAWFNDGVWLDVPAKQVLDKPIQILHLSTQAETLLATRTVIVINEQAEASVIETFTGLDNTRDGVYAAGLSGAGAANAYFSAAVTEVFVGENAGLTLSKVQCESDKAYHFGGTYIKQAKDARLTHNNFAFGGLLARSDIHADLDQGSDCEFNGLYLGVKRQHIDNHTRINHLKPYALSRELYKGVLDDRARGVFQGRVIVAEGAQKTDSQMNNRNLLLSDDAEADTKPQLEIYADDVKCGHGVTVGQLDEKSVFYLQSRCVDEDSARNMLTFAFANEMVDKIKIKSLHDLVLAQVLARFPQSGINQDWL